MIQGIARHRVALGWLVALAALYLASPNGVSLAAGAPLALAGLATRGLAAGTIRKGTELARSGPYAFSRNPLYLGSSLLALGFGVMSGSVLAAAVLLIPSALVYPLVIRNEERHLRERFGREFDAFRDSVPRFFPRRIDRRALESFTFGQFMANGEYNATIGFLAATGILTAKYLISAA